MCETPAPERVKETSGNLSIVPNGHGRYCIQVKTPVKALHALLLTRGGIIIRTKILYRSTFTDTLWHQYVESLIQRLEKSDCRSSSCEAEADTEEKHKTVLPSHLSVSLQSKSQNFGKAVHHRESQDHPRVGRPNARALGVVTFST